MSAELFRGIKQWEFEWEGEKAKLPVFYYDNTSMTAIYTASTGRVKKLLPHPAMKPIELYPGRCLAAFTAFEYRKTDIDPYNEFSISFLISFGKPQIPGLSAARQMSRRYFTAYVWQLPVTTEIARRGGVELYGYPKFLADITFQKEKGWMICDLVEKGKKILSLKGKVLQTSRGRITRYTTYSVLEDIPLAANVYVDPIEFAQSRDRRAASLELGTGHAISETLKGIGLGKAPVVYQFSPANQAILFAGRNMIDS